MLELHKSWILPMRYTTKGAWDREGDNLYSGCVFDEPFGSIPAGEYRSVFVSIEMRTVTAVTADEVRYEADFTLNPKESK